MRAATIMVALLLCACASDSDRYTWNLAHQDLMPNANRLPRADIEEITRLVTQKTSQPILGIARQRTGPHAGEVTVVTYRPGAHYPETAGLYTLQKKAGRWRITYGGRSLSESIIGLALREGPA